MRMARTHQAVSGSMATFGGKLESFAQSYSKEVGSHLPETVATIACSLSIGTLIRASVD